MDCPAKKIVKCGIDKQGIEMVSIKPKDKPREPHEVGCMCPFCVPSVEQPSPLPPIEKIVRVDPPIEVSMVQIMGKLNEVILRVNGL